VAATVWAPAVVEEKVYVAEPLTRASEEVSVVPSTTTVTVPVGAEVLELDAGATVMVMMSLPPDAGEVVAGESVVVVVASVGELEAGQAVSR